jgi:hypothetical protein
MKTSAKSKQIVKNRTRLEWALLIALLLILWLFLASRYSWWPLSVPDDNLGTAFYITKHDKSGSNTDDDGSGSGDGGGSGSGNGGSGNSSRSALLNFAAGLDSGDSKEQVSGEAQGIEEDCALLFNSTESGKFEVCTYREGDKLVTVTFRDDRVVSASRSGF